MEIIKDINRLSEITGIKINQFPPFYLNEYYANQQIEINYFLIDKTIVPIAFSKHYFLKKAQFLFPPLSNNQPLNANDEQVFLDKIINHILKHKLADRIIPSANYCVFKAVPKDSKAAPFGTYYLNLGLTEDELWANIHPKHKNVIRNAEKKGCEIKVGTEQLPVFYQLFSETMQRSQLSFPSLDFFSSMIKNMSNDNLICAVVYYNEKAQGALLMPYSMYGAYYVYGASANQVEITGVNNYMHWEIIKLLKQKGVMRYDFVGARLSDVSNTKLAGIQMFKERFGSALEKGFLWKMDLSFKCKLYDFLVNLKSKLLFKPAMFIDIIDQERNKNS